MPITALPAAPARTDPPAVFIPKADAFVAALPGFVTEANALETNVNTKSQNATDKAAAASTSEANALSYRDTAEGHKNAASASATLATNYATYIAGVVPGTSEYSAKYYAAQAAAAAQVVGSAAAFSSNVKLIKGISDATRGAYVNIESWSNGENFTFNLPRKNGTFAMTVDIDARPITYITSSTSPSLNFTSGSYVGYAPTPGTTATITITGLTVSAIGTSGSFRPCIIEGYRLGASTLTWPAISWIKPDGTTTTSIAAAGFTLSTTGTDFVILWMRGGSSEILGKVVR